MTHLSLRTKILLSILIPFFIALLILTISGFSVIDTGVKKIVSDQQVSIAELIASRMNDNLEKYARLLHSFFPPPHKKINELILNQTIKEFEESNLNLIFDQGILLYDENGSIIIQSHGTPVVESLSPSIIYSLKTSRNYYYSSLNIKNEIQYISLFVPIFSDSDGLLYIIEGKFSPEYSIFGSMLVDVLEVRKGTTGYAILIDQSGNIIYKRFIGDLYDEGDISLIKQFSNSDQNSPSSIIFYNNISEKEEYAGYSPIPGTSWGVIAREDRDVLYRDLNYHYFLTILLIFTTICFTLFLIYLLIHSFLKPLSLLISRIRDIEKGNFDLIPVPESEDEVGVLAHRFNQMVHSLKESFEKLETAKRRYWLILDQSYDGFILIRPQSYEILETNRMAREITGYSDIEMSQLNFTSLLFEPEKSPFFDAVSEISSEGMKTELMAQLLKKDNTIITVDITLIKIRIDDKIKIQVTIRDITKKIAAEKESKEKTKELNRFFSLNLDLLAILDFERRFKRLNPEWTLLTGYSTDELLSMSLSDLIHPDDRDITILRILSLKVNSYPLDTSNRIRCKDNTYRWIEWRIVRYDDLIYTAARDITERKEADEKIQSGVQMLAQTQETLATLNDQIRNPLSIIMIYTEECEEMNGKKIRDEVMRIDAIIDTLDKGWIQSDKVRRVMQKYFEEK